MELQLQQHRKFIKYSINETATDICPSYCDSSDTSSFCNPPCVTSCPSYCHNFLQSLIPSPSPVIFKYNIHHKSRKFLIITASALATTIAAVLCYVVFVKFYLRRRSSSEPRIINQTHDDFLDEDHGPVVDHPIWYINTVGLQPSVIREIAVLKYKKGDGLVEGTECSVCLSEFQEDETLRLLPKCNHAFHISCIDTWLRSHTNCPLCRAPIVKINHAARAQSSSSSSSESNNEHSGTRQSTQVGIFTENDGRNNMESEIGAVERRNINERNDQDSDDEIHPIRRSVSLDSLSASKMIQGLGNFDPEEITRNSGTQLAKERDLSVKTVPKKVGRSESLMRSLQNAPVSLMRSLSYSGKFLL